LAHKDSMARASSGLAPPSGHVGTQLGSGASGALASLPRRSLRSSCVGVDMFDSLHDLRPSSAGLAFFRARRGTASSSLCFSRRRITSVTRASGLSSPKRVCRSVRVCDGMINEVMGAVAVDFSRTWSSKLGEVGGWEERRLFHRSATIKARLRLPAEGRESCRCMRPRALRELLARLTNMAAPACARTHVSTTTGALQHITKKQQQQRANNLLRRRALLPPLHPTRGVPSSVAAAAAADRPPYRGISTTTGAVSSGPREDAARWAADLDTPTANSELSRLCEEIATHDVLYYNDAAPAVSDAEVGRAVQVENPVDPERLNAAWFQPLSLASEELVASLCLSVGTPAGSTTNIKMQLVPPLRRVRPAAAAARSLGGCVSGPEARRQPDAEGRRAAVAAAVVANVIVADFGVVANFVVVVERSRCRCRYRCRSRCARLFIHGGALHVESS
jgi:hypothetical protein